jgi:hypothetical protein
MGGPVAEVLDQPYSQITTTQQRRSRTGPSVYIGWNRVHCPSYVSWRAGMAMATPLSGLS